MAVFTRESAIANVRTKDGRRVFYLADGDHLTPSAADWLKQEGIEVMPFRKPDAYKGLDGSFYPEKPEHMTHLRADTLVRKDHPRIRFRGMIDELEAEILLAASMAGADAVLVQHLEEILQTVRMLIPCDVLEQPVEKETLCGLTMDQVRTHSHFPQKYYGLPHFMPSCRDSAIVLQLNKVRTAVRRTELAAYDAFHDREGLVTRADILKLLNRLSSMLWILMIRKKKEEQDASGCE